MQIVFFLYEGMTALDLVGPHEILSRLPEAEVKRVAKKAGPIRSDSGLFLTADFSIENVSSGDVLLIPGAGNATSLRKEPEVLEWIRKIHKQTKWTTSVCTGSLILGAAGLLRGVKATTHWAALDRLVSWGAKPSHSRVIEDGKIMTSAGVSAGIDMALILSANIAGETIGEALELGIEYDPAPPFQRGSVSKANPLIRKALQAKMRAFFEEP